MSKTETLRPEASLPFVVTFLLFVLLGICSAFSVETISSDRIGEEASGLFVRDRPPADHALSRYAARNKAVAELRFLCLGKDRKITPGGGDPFVLPCNGPLAVPAGIVENSSRVSRPVLVAAAGHHTRARAPPAISA